MAALLAVPIVVALLLWLYYPTIPRSVLGWILLLVIGIPTWIVLEWLGHRLLEARFFSRLGSVARIALAVPILILFMIAAGYLVRLGQTAIGGS